MENFDQDFAIVVTVVFLLFAVWSVLESMKQERDDNGRKKVPGIRTG